MKQKSIANGYFDTEQYFQVVPFIEEGNYFIVKQSEVNQIFDVLVNRHRFEQIEPIRQALFDLKFTKEEMESHVLHHIPLVAYDTWKLKFRNYCLNQIMEPTIDMDLQESSDLQKINHWNGDEVQILNKNNPFADVEIKEQAFLYPSPKGFQVLSFNTQKQFIRREYEDGCYYAIIPGFRVSKQKERKPSSTIIATDSVSTALPEMAEEKRVVYI